MPRFKMFEMRRLWVDEQARRDRKGRSLGRIRSAGDPQRAPKPYWAAEQPGRQFRQSVELAGSAGQDHVTAPVGRDRACGQAVTDHFKDFLDPWSDDVHYRRPRYELRLLALVLVQRRNGDHVAFVRSSAKHSAIKRFDSLGVGNPSVQATRQVHGDVVSTKRETVDVNEPPSLEGSKCGGAGAQSDPRGT